MSSVPGISLREVQPTPSADVVERALAKLASGALPGNVAAVVVGRKDSPGLDGFEWWVAVTDGSQVKLIELGLSGTTAAVADATFDPTELERIVEMRAINSFPLDGRLDALIAAGPLWLTPDEARTLA